MPDAASPHEQETVTHLRLADVLDRYQRDAEIGLDPDPEACLRAHADLAGELGACLEGLAAIQELRAELCPEPAAEEEPPPRRLGRYELLEKLGEGGMGVVYKARDTRLGRLVALKTIRPEKVTSEADLIRFRNEGEILADLDHPAIVPIYEVGEEGGWLFYSMQLMEGGSLAGQLDRYRADPRAAAQLVKTIAFAVRHVHQRGVFHRDLKPSNILLDRDGQPKVSDFGLAKRLAGDDDLTLSGAAVGTLPYMAPEQLLGKRGSVTWQTDVYGLGGILYALLTGREPCRGADQLETLERVRDVDPVPPRAQNPLVERDLEIICLKCLRKEPQDRYIAAGKVGEDIDRWLNGAPIKARRAGRLERTLKWCRRNPTWAGAAVAVVALVVGMTYRAFSVARDRAERLEQKVLQSNRYAAQNVASTILWQLDRFSAPVVETAAKEELRRLLKARDRKALDQFLLGVHGKYKGLARPVEASPFATWYVIDTEGWILGVAPEPPDRKFLDIPYSLRDYFAGALKRSGESGRAAVHVSRIFKAYNQGFHKFALSVVVRDTDDTVLGVLAATITTKAALGGEPLDSGGQTAVLVGRRDPNPPNPKEPTEPGPDYLILMHPAYSPGASALGAPAERLRTLHRPRPGDEFQIPEFGRALPEERTTDADYRDPLAARDPNYEGRWLAGFAPVGNTEFVVIVQQRYDDVVGSDRAMLLDMLLWVAGALALGGLCVGLLVLNGVRRAAPA